MTVLAIGVTGVGLPASAALAVAGAGAGWLAWTVAERVLAEREEGILPLPSWSRPATTLAGAALFVGTGSVIGVTAVLPAYLWFVTATLALLLTDLRAQLIPDRISGPATTVGAVLLFVGAVIEGDHEALPRAAISGAVYFVVLFAIYIVGRGSFGGGDVKLGPLLGLFTGFLGLAELLGAIVLGFLLGGIVAVALVVFRLRSMRDHFAFGPVLILGAYAALAWGEPLIEWYLR